jgi:hypothetical protein
MARLRKEAARKKAMGTSIPVRARKKATAGRPVRRPADLPSGSDIELESVNIVPKAEEEESGFSDVE